MNENELLKRINLLEFHQRLLLKMLNEPNLDFYKLIIEKGISEHQVQNFNHLCDQLNIKMEEQKAEGFMYFHPLFSEFLSLLPSGLDGKEVIKACISQRLYDDLFLEFKKYL